MLGFQLLRPILSAFDIEMWDFILDMQCRNIKGFLFIRQILLSTRPQWLIHKCWNLIAFKKINSLKYDWWEWTAYKSDARRSLIAEKSFSITIAACPAKGGASQTQKRSSSVISILWIQNWILTQYHSICFFCERCFWQVILSPPFYPPSPLNRDGSPMRQSVWCKMCKM